MIRKILLLTSACRCAALIRVYDAETGRFEWDLNCKYEFHPETFWWWPSSATTNSAPPPAS